MRSKQCYRIRTYTNMWPASFGLSETFAGFICDVAGNKNYFLVISVIRWYDTGRGTLMAKRKKKRPLSRKKAQHGLIVGVAWYTPEQWKRLKLLADDSEALDDTHKDWLKNATGHVQWLKQRGFEVVKVPIDIDEWVAWCKKHRKALNGAARSEFTSQKVSEKFKESSPPSQYVSRQIKLRPNPIPFLDKLETMFEAERDKTIPRPTLSIEMVTRYVCHGRLRPIYNSWLEPATKLRLLSKSLN